MRTFRVLRKVLFLTFVLAAIGDVYAVFNVQITNPNSNDLEDYQVRVNISEMTQVFGTQLVRVTDTNGNKLNFCYEQSNGECNTTPSNIIWVKVPRIPANGKAHLIIYPSDTNQATDASNVFIRVIDGLVGAWHFDEGQGNIAHDSSGNNNHGTIYGAKWVDGKFGKALEFDGVDDYVEIGRAHV